MITSTFPVVQAVREPYKAKFIQFMAANHPDIPSDDLRWLWYENAYLAGRSDLTDAIIDHMSQDTLQTGNEAQNEN